MDSVAIVDIMSPDEFPYIHAVSQCTVNSLPGAQWRIQGAMNAHDAMP